MILNSISDSADNVEKSVTFSNPFPTINKWYFIVCKWKSGEKLKLSINNANEVQSASNVYNYTKQLQAIISNYIIPLEHQ